MRARSLSLQKGYCARVPTSDNSAAGLFELRDTQVGFQVWSRFEEPKFTIIESVAMPKLPILFVFGSSVSLGKGAKKTRGWVDLVEVKANFRIGKISNRSVSGATTKTTLELLNNIKDVPTAKDSIACVSLSLSNEGLDKTESHVDKRRVARSFQTGMQLIVDRLKILGFRNIIVCTPYPCSRYTLSDHEIVLDIIQYLHEDTRDDVAVIDFYSSLNDGKGKWKADLRFDDFHPNSEGHARMAELFRGYLR